MLQLLDTQFTTSLLRIETELLGTTGSQLLSLAYPSIVSLYGGKVGKERRDIHLIIHGKLKSRYNRRSPFDNQLVLQPIGCNRKVTRVHELFCTTAMHQQYSTLVKQLCRTLFNLSIFPSICYSINSVMHQSMRAYWGF